jgi:hypothetical protein
MVGCELRKLLVLSPEGESKAYALVRKQPPSRADSGGYVGITCHQHNCVTAIEEEKFNDPDRDGNVRLLLLIVPGRSVAAATVNVFRLESAKLDQNARVLKARDQFPMTVDLVLASVMGQGREIVNFLERRPSAKEVKVGGTESTEIQPFHAAGFRDSGGFHDGVVKIEAVD